MHARAAHREGLARGRVGDVVDGRDAGAEGNGEVGLDVRDLHVVEDNALEVCRHTRTRAVCRQPGWVGLTEKQHGLAVAGWRVNSSGGGLAGWLWFGQPGQRLTAHRLGLAIETGEPGNEACAC